MTRGPGVLSVIACLPQLSAYNFGSYLFRAANEEQILIGVETSLFDKGNPRGFQFLEEGIIVKRERARQIVVGLVGLLYVALLYPLYTDLLHSSWLLVQKNETEPMFLSFYIALGFFLLLAARKPSDYRSLIFFAAWQSIAHASVMVIQTVEAWKNGIHRDFTDVVIAGVIGVVLLTVVSAKRQAAATGRGSTWLEPDR